MVEITLKKVLRIRFRSKQQLFIVFQAWRAKNIVDHLSISKLMSNV
jgi:hypothetical protein